MNSPSFLEQSMRNLQN